MNNKNTVLLASLLFLLGHSSFSGNEDNFKHENTYKENIKKLHGTAYYPSPMDNIDILKSLPENYIRGIIDNNTSIMESILVEINRHELSLLKNLFKDEKLSNQDKNKVFLSALIAKAIVDMHDASETACRAAKYAVSSIPAWDTVSRRHIYEDNCWYNASSFACSVGYVASGDIWEDAKSVARNDETDEDFTSVVERVKITLNKLSFKSEEEQGSDSYILGKLFALNWVLKNNSKTFIDVVISAYGKLDGSLSIEELMKTIDERIAKMARENNTNIIELKRLFTDLMPETDGSLSVEEMIKAFVGSNNQGSLESNLFIMDLKCFLKEVQKWLNSN